MAVFLDRPLDHRLRVGEVGDVDADAERAPLERLDFLDDTVDLFLVAPADYEVSALAREP
jgi:hypothetical protein